MPGLSRKALHSCPSSCKGPNTDARHAIWNRSDADDISFSELQKFWTQLPSAARRELLRIDKLTLFEKVRKNLYCSRCHGLLIEGFSQIVMYGKSLQGGGQVRGCSDSQTCCNRYPMENEIGASSITFDDTKDPSVHPWGGLAVTRDSMLTVMDCFLDGMPLEVLQNVFQSARARERERELLYPDACGGCGRGWISHSGSNGRAHGMKETCALHNARLSCEALVDFWSALGEETRSSLLRMKEEDFIERLIHRFDSKRFCRDCRRNVLREFKEMKELKRIRKEPKCTRWFCAPDTVFRYEVSNTFVHVDWRDCFPGEVKTLYQHFEWAMGSTEGKSDIFGFEDLGLSESVMVDSLDLGNITDCFVTVRGWRRDGRCTELCAKAHALKGQFCVHRRLFVGDGYVSISKGESIQHFFEHAEETEEEEDEDSFDKDGNEIDGEGSRPQKHAKSPELARDFLLDAATVIFKEQVEKAFREGTARQNAHSIFVCLALSLLEERVRIACKEITTLEKQNKLLEEEEAEKREEEERRERKKLKEKEKKLRRKEKVRSKDCDKDRESVTGNLFMSDDLSFAASEEDKSCSSNLETNYRNDDSLSVRSSSTDMTEVRPSADGFESDDGGKEAISRTFPEIDNVATFMHRDGNGAFTVEQSKFTKRRLQNKFERTDVASRYSRRISEPFERSRRAHLRAGPAPYASPSHPEQNVHKNQVHMKSEGSKHDGACTSKRFESWNQPANYLQSKSDFQHCACRSMQSYFRLKAGPRSSGRMATKVSERNVSVHNGANLLLSTPNGHLDFKNDHTKSGQKAACLGTAEIEQKDCQKIASEVPRLHSGIIPCLSVGVFDTVSTCKEPVVQAANTADKSFSHATETKCNHNPSFLEDPFTGIAGSGGKHLSHSLQNARSSSTPTVSMDCTNGCSRKESHSTSVVHVAVTDTEGFSASAELMSPQYIGDQKISRESVSVSGLLSDTLSSITENGCTAEIPESTSCTTAIFANKVLTDRSLQSDLLCNANFSPQEDSSVATCNLRVPKNECSVTAESSGGALEGDMQAAHTTKRVSQLQASFNQKSNTANLSSVGEIPKTVPYSSPPNTGRDINNAGHIPAIQVVTVQASKSSHSVVGLSAPQGEMHRLLQTSTVVSPSMPLVPPHKNYACYPMQGPWTSHRRNDGLPVLQGSGYFVPRPTGFEFQRYAIAPLIYPVAVSSQLSIYPPNARNISRSSSGSNAVPLKDPLSSSKSREQCLEMARTSSCPIDPSQNGILLASEQCPNEFLPSESQVVPALKTADSVECFFSSESSGFSLFHFGGPTSLTKLGTESLVSTNVADETALRNLSDMSNCKFSADYASEMTKPKAAGEYSLFAAAPRKGFGFF
ncbi:hypothetical protein O6H91_08G034700 [Diphasiastrum complanatum]|uniref:Uncharacterized protein n=1 Tax=Diphasiastrum complanatum TaxID=34168 RepID=A0ACC2CWD2_DIPCM|nr:hypothetical protein O6H91_08G034700 [Diphasiastrum complanatum]